jgi:hypothetical protein
MKANVKEIMMNAKKALLKGQTEEARNQLNFGIIVLSRLTMEGIESTEGASVDRWKERFWFQLEENDLIEE